MSPPFPNVGLGMAILALCTLAGCVTVPMGPRVPVMPPPGKPFEVFVADDRACQGYAAQTLEASPNAAGAQNLVASAAVGTAVGALAGAALGGNRGAAVGAGEGLFAGTLFGTGLAGEAQAIAQRRYDIAYTQCMYAKGNRRPRAAFYGQPEGVVINDAPAVYPPADYPPPPP